MKRLSWIKVDPRQATMFDYVLVIIAELCAAFSVSQAVGTDSLIPIYFGAVGGGLAFSYIVSRVLKNSPFLKLDGLLFAVAGITALTQTQRLNLLLPENPFQAQLIVASALIWLMIAGGFFAWRDGSLLFGAVPAVAAFGLVGIWDTFKSVTWVFFGFIMCLALLFGRAHSRQMTHMAEFSGFRRVEALREGQWRWMAGAEWAVGSAIAIIFLSLLGAPVIRSSTKGLNGFARTNLLPRPNVSSEPGVTRGVEQTARIGTGPNNVGDQVMLSAQTPGPMYLRSGVFDYYDNGSWRNSFESPANAAMDRDVSQLGLTYIPESNREQIEFRVRPQVSMQVMPTPYEPISIKTQSTEFTNANLNLGVVDAPIYRNSGGLIVVNARSLAQGNSSTFSGTSIRPISEDSTKSPKAKNRTDWYLRMNGISPKVIEATENVIKGAKTDREKADRIKAFIEKQCKYNLQAPATPAGQDPVEYFLFTSKQGYCDLFASSMVQMARVAEIPARYATGYYPVRGEKDDAGYYILRQRDAHAWAELLFEGSGWVSYDTTEGAQQVEGGKLGETAGLRPILSRLLYPVVGVLALGAAALYAARKLKFRSRVVDERAVMMQRVGRVYVRYEKILMGLVGRPRKLGQTSREYLDSASEKLGPAYEIAAQINRLFDEAMYDPASPTPEQIEKLDQQVKGLASKVKDKK